MLATNELVEALEALGELLLDRGLHFEVAIIGGGALAISGLIERPTKDLDVVAIVVEGELKSAVPLPVELAEAVRDVARVRTINADWLNSGPGPMIEYGLPTGFSSRCSLRDFGGLTVRFASRYDQIHFKLHAAVDDKPGGKHHRDLQQLNPSREELLEAAAWTHTHDTSLDFAELLRQVLLSFGVVDK